MKWQRHLAVCILLRLTAGVPQCRGKLANPNRERNEEEECKKDGIVSSENLHTHTNNICLP